MHRRKSQQSRKPLPAVSILPLEPRTLFTAPAATFDPPTFTPGAANFAVTIHLTDTTPILTSDIGPSNLAVTGPLGPLKVTRQQFSSSQNGQQVSITYYLDAPNQIWDQRANGNYAIAIVGTQLFDAAGAVVPATSTAMTVALAPITQPLAAASQPSGVSISTPGTTGADFQVTYSDPLGIDLSTIRGTNFDIFSTSLNGKVLATTSQDGGKVVHVDYFLSAPRGAFFPGDDTTYHIVVSHTPANEVKNLAGTPVSAPGLLGAFLVTVSPNDPSFAFADTTSSTFTPEASALQSTGKKIVVGHIGDTTTGASRLQVERFNADGSLDSTFAANGLYLGPAGSNEAAFAVTVLPNDQILLAGTSARQFLVQRLTPNGAIDPSFGAAGTGKVTQTLNPDASTEIADALAVATDGTIVAAGQVDGQWAFARFSSTGQPLNNFQLPLPDNLDGTVGNLSVAASGVITAAGSDGNAIDIARFIQDGTPDPTFNNGGLLALSSLAVRSNLGHLDHAVGLAVQPDGKILVASRTVSSPAQLATQRLNADGAPDTTFGPAGTGLLVATVVGDPIASTITLQTNHTILVAGVTTDPTGNHPVSVTYNPDGSLFVPPPVVPPTPPPVTPPPAITFSISGTVLDQQGNPLAGRTVFADVNGTSDPAAQPQAVTSNAGTFSITGLTSGTYLLREIVPSGFQQTAPPNAAALAATVAGANLTGLAFVESPSAQAPAPPTASIGGTVFNAKTGAPLPGITVSLNTGQSTTTDASGLYSFSSLPDATYTVTQSLPAGLSSATISSDVTVVGAPATGPVFADVPANAAPNALAPQITAAFVKVPRSAILGSAGKLQLHLTNTGNAKATGIINIALFASTTRALTAPQTPFATIPVRIRLNPKRSATVTLKFHYPAALPSGAYYLLASIDPLNTLAEANPATAIAVSPATVAITAPFATLTATVNTPPREVSGKPTTLTLTLTNTGNVPATGVATLTLLIAQNPNDASIVASKSAAASLHVSLRPGARSTYHLRIKSPQPRVAAGTYFVGARLARITGLTTTNINGLEAFAAAPTTFS